MTTIEEPQPSKRLTAACWPVFEFVTNFVRQVKNASAHAPEQVRFEALTALRDAEDISRDDPATERLWDDYAKAMLVYVIDYKMLNTDWHGRERWFNDPFETDPGILNHAQALGGEEFFVKCDEIQREYEQAERRDRRDKHQLAELLELYFICLRLGFKGQYHDRPQELADYTRRLFTRLPAYSTTRDKEMFPQAYRHVEQVKVNYNLGRNLTLVLVVFFGIFAASIVAFRIAWEQAGAKIQRTAEQWDDAAAAHATAP
jgi:type IV/VI secretion system ImpK/VasF family protein